MALILNGSDTSAGNDAGLGYTSAEGIIITGQGTTSDVTIKNDADATVLSIPTGTTQVGINTTAPSAQFQVHSPALGTTAGDTQDILQLHSPDTSNTTIYKFFNYRHSNGSSHSESELRWQRRVDSTNQGYIGLRNEAVTFGYGDNTERMRIDSSGNVGIGETSPAAQLHVKNSGGNSVSIVGQYGTGTRAEISAFANQVELRAYNGTNDVMTFKTGSTERMRITSDGRLLTGTTTSYGRVHSVNMSFSPSNSAWLTGASFVSSGSFGGGYAFLDGSAGYSMYCAESGSDFFIQHHSSLSAAATGGVKLDNAATSWTSASDEREKENLVEITDATTKIKSLRTVIGNYTWQPEVKHAFLIAQDVQTVLPEAVSVVNKSATTDEQRLGIRYTEVIPLLTAALKESLEKIEALEARITALEAG